LEREKWEQLWEERSQMKKCAICGFLQLQTSRNGRCNFKVACENRRKKLEATIDEMKRLEKEAIAEAKQLEKEAKRLEMTREILGKNDWWNGTSTSTATSKFRQAREPGQTDPGRLTVQSAKTAGFHGIEILDDLLPEEAEQQLLDCTASKCILPIDHPRVQVFIKLIQKTFYRGKEKCHSRAVSHANFRAPKGMKEIYKAVALELGDGITIRSASNFRNKAIASAEKPTAETKTAATVSTASTTPVHATAPVPIAHAAPVPAEQTTTAKTEDVADLPELMPREEETNPGTTDVITSTSSSLIMKFLKEHWETHALPTTFFSLSSQDSFVYYKKDNEVVAQLLIPAGFSIVVTTEIHSGLKSLNPHKLKHYSESADDRLLFRIVHELPRDGIYMDRTGDDWIEFATNAVKQIFN
jgi:hypothetical protein